MIPSILPAAEVAPDGVSLRNVLAGLNQRRLLYAFLFLGIFAYNLMRPTDIDFWWHIKTGELIASTGAVPTSDPFSYTALGRPWVVHEWIWELAAFAVYGWGGYVLAAILSAAIVVLTYVILYRLIIRLGANEFVAVALVFWAAFVSMPGVGVRPRELTQLFTALFLSRLILYRRGEARRLWALPPAMALWVNVHGQFVLGLALLAMFALDGIVGWLLAGGRSPRHLLLVSAATLAAGVLNPEGLEIVRYPLSYYLQGDNPSFALVTEFQSPDFHQFPYLVFAASLLLLAVLPRKLDRHTLLEALLVVVFSVQALVSARQIAAYALVISPLLALRLVDGFPLARRLAPPTVSRPLVVLNWLILVGIVGLVSAYAAQPEVFRALQLGREPNTRSLPVEGARYIEDAGLPDPVFNDQGWGGYLIYRWYPQRRVFIDGRIDMYGQEIVRDYLAVTSPRPDWREVLDSYGVQTILIEKDSSLSTLLLADGGWKRVFRGSVEEVFVREGSQ